MDFTPLKTTDQDLLKYYFDMRDIKSCEYCFATLVLWNNRYNITYHTTENYVLFMEEYEGEVYAIMPVCKEEHFEEAFGGALRRHFEDLGLPLIIYVADEVFTDYIRENHLDEFEITTNRDEYDYMYDAQALRSLKARS